MNSLSIRLQQINPRLDEWCLEHKPLNRSQCISLLEHSIILSRLDVVKYILAVINGFDSELFHWNESKREFYVVPGYATAHLNSGTFRRFLSQFAQLGTQFRQMFEFTKMEYFRGQTYLAFQNVLGNILEEIIHKTIEIREYFINNKSKTASEFNISLLALAPHLDSDLNGNIILTIRNLYAIFQDVNQELKFNLPRHYCNRTLTAICKRLFIPHRRIRNVVYTMLDYCLQPTFISIEFLLTHFETVEQLADTGSSEFLFSSEFNAEEDLYYDSYWPNELKTFWNNFFHFDNELCQGLHLFSTESLKTITEAIKGSFVLRKNGLPAYSLSNCLGKFTLEFRSNLKNRIKLYSLPEDEFDVETQYDEEFYNLKIMGSIKDMVHLPPLRTCHFKSYNLPNTMVYDLHTIIQESINSTFITISQPIVNEFLTEFRIRHLKLFHYYADFFLLQNPHHILQYVFFLFPVIKDAVATRTFDVIEAILKHTHQNCHNEYRQVLAFFEPCISRVDEINFNNEQLELELFDLFYFSPSFSKDLKSVSNSKSSSRFYDFWPLTQLFFNHKVTEVFNRLFQFLLKLRYLQYLIGVNFFLSEKFRNNQIKKENYLFRFRLLNSVVLMGRQMESRLCEIVQTTEREFKNANTFEDYLTYHEKFLEKLSTLYEETRKNLFANNIFRSIIKFCQTRVSKNLKNRRFTIFDQSIILDRTNQDDFFGSLQL